MEDSAKIGKNASIHHSLAMKTPKETLLTVPPALMQKTTCRVVGAHLGLNTAHK